MKSQYIWLFVILVILLSIFAVYRQDNETSDTNEYYLMAEMFASGETNIQMYSAHSALYPYIIGKLTGDFYSDGLYKFIGFLIILTICLLLYLITKKELSVFLLLLCPVTVGVVGTNGPVLIAALFFLLAYFFLTKWVKTRHWIFLVISGLLMGFCGGFYFLVFVYMIFLMFVFFIDVKFKYFLSYLIFVLIGLIPKFLFDSFYYGFPLHSILRLFSSNVVARVLNTSYNSGSSPLYSLFNNFQFFMNDYFFALIIMFISLLIPLYFIFKKLAYRKYKKEFWFLGISSLCVFILGGLYPYSFVFLPALFILFTKSTTRMTKQRVTLILIIFIIISSYIVYSDLTNNMNNFNSQIKEDSLAIQEDFEVKEFILGWDMLQVVRNFDNSYQFYWWDEYIAEEEGYEIYTSFYFEEEPKFEILRLIYFDFGYKRNAQELPNEPYFILMNTYQAPNNLEELECYEVLCVYKQQ